jgi:hypothetical protein
MNIFKNLLEKKNLNQLILVILFIIYLIFKIRMPLPVANVIDNMYSKIIIVILALVLLMHSNPILGILGILVAYELIKRSTMQSGNSILQQYYPNEEKKWSPFSSTNQFPYTLEQEVVKHIAPTVNMINGKASFSPVLDNLYDAAPINYNGVI